MGAQAAPIFLPDALEGQIGPLPDWHPAICSPHGYIFYSVTDERWLINPASHGRERNESKDIETSLHFSVWARAGGRPWMHA
jgi:hypothetical protein